MPLLLHDLPWLYFLPFFLEPFLPFFLPFLFFLEPFLPFLEPFLDLLELELEPALPELLLDGARNIITLRDELLLLPGLTILEGLLELLNLPNPLLLLLPNLLLLLLLKKRTELELELESGRRRLSLPFPFGRLSLPNALLLTPALNRPPLLPLPKGPENPLLLSPNGLGLPPGALLLLRPGLLVKKLLLLGRGRGPGPPLSLYPPP